MNTRPITATLNKWLKNNGYDLTTFCDKEFAYYPQSNRISYSLVVLEDMDRYFMEFAKSLGLSVDCGIFILSFFHELGHYETEDEISDYTESRCEKIKATLDSTKKKDIFRYFNLADEKTATEWAVTFINDNEDSIAELATKLSTEFNKIVLD